MQAAGQGCHFKPAAKARHWGLTFGGSARMTHIPMRLRQLLSTCAPTGTRPFAVTGGVLLVPAEMYTQRSKPPWYQGRRRLAWRV